MLDFTLKIIFAIHYIKINYNDSFFFHTTQKNAYKRRLKRPIFKKRNAYHSHNS